MAYSEKSIYKQKAETPVIHSRGHCHPGRERGASGACAEASASIRGLTRFSVPCCVHRLERDRIRVSPPVASYVIYFLLLLCSSFRVGFSSIYKCHSLGLLQGNLRDASESRWRMVQCRLIEFCALHHLGRQLAVGFSTMNVPVYEKGKNKRVGLAEMALGTLLKDGRFDGVRSVTVLFSNERCYWSVDAASGGHASYCNGNRCRPPPRVLAATKKTNI